MSTEKDAQKEFLKLYAYGTLATFMLSVSARGEVDEDEGRMLLRLQNELIKQFDSTLTPLLDPAAMESFREFVSKYRARMS